MSFGTPRPITPWTLDKQAAGPIFRQALELGITFWDTANIYGNGTSEEITGEAIREYARREDIVLATKVFQRMNDAVQRIGQDRGVPMAQVALAWVLRNPVVSAPIVGPTKPHHLTDAAAALDLALTDEDIRALEDPYTPREPTYFS
jgi:aryl-alcohol dehydrogenase-like predicted oxidoreductase